MHGRDLRDAEPLVVAEEDHRAGALVRAGGEDRVDLLAAERARSGLRDPDARQARRRVILPDSALKRDRVVAAKRGEVDAACRRLHLGSTEVLDHISPRHVVQWLPRRARERPQDRQPIPDRRGCEPPSPKLAGERVERVDRFESKIRSVVDDRQRWRDACRAFVVVDRREERRGIDRLEAAVAARAAPEHVRGSPRANQPIADVVAEGASVREAEPCRPSVMSVRAQVVLCSLACGSEPRHGTEGNWGARGHHHSTPIGSRSSQATNPRPEPSCQSLARRQPDASRP